MRIFRTVEVMMLAHVALVAILAAAACVTTGDTSSLKQSAAPEVTAAGRDYAAALYRCAKSSYVSPDPRPDEGKRAVVRVKVASDGTFTETLVSQSSGIAAFDDAALAAVHTCSGKLAPPEAQRDALRKAGLELSFTP
jgi:TonB family protein